ncbi:Transposase IS66 family protein [Anaerovirgula multivorans]|uniref:Transposase IS66 family protein n=1 Tax=Anaerovirgula multivorans TaxID=312168 RepID=A0A239L4Y6_9FIRM|nr:IS66 family transposase [Anaerovirgula multivorans]SNT25385.1 Transposase IS66 family protein [Anaerovirgula multivorans]
MKSKIGQALQYVKNQQSGLIAYLEDGNCEISNNLALLSISKEPSSKSTLRLGKRGFGACRKFCVNRLRILFLDNNGGNDKIPKIARMSIFMSNISKEVLRNFIKEQNFSNPNEVLAAMKEMFRDVLQEALEAEDG